MKFALVLVIGCFGILAVFAGAYLEFQHVLNSGIASPNPQALLMSGLMLGGLLLGYMCQAILEKMERGY